jgi:hypothetical protein
MSVLAEFLNLRQLAALAAAIKQARAGGTVRRVQVKGGGEAQAFSFDREINWFVVDKGGKAVARGQLPLEAGK